MNTKSATTAGLLGIFLGAFGAHNWYLGEKNKGIAHICMMAGGILVEVVASIILPNVLSFSALLTAASILGILGGIASIAMTASGIWGLVEGIQILVGGDAGLTAKGFPVASAMSQPYNNIPQPNYGPQNFNQPMQQPMPTQSAPNQPMQQNFNQPMNYGQPMQQQPMPNYNQPMQNQYPERPAASNQSAPENSNEVPTLNGTGNNGQ